MDIEKLKNKNLLERGYEIVNNNATIDLTKPETYNSMTVCVLAVIAKELMILNSKTVKSV